MLFKSVKQADSMTS